MYPYYVERKIFFNQSDRKVPVPCGKCPDCLKRRVASWSQRLEMEQLRWERSYFLTLTYDTDHVPISPNGFMTLSDTTYVVVDGKKKQVSSHMQEFLKRVRFYGGKLCYYYCGEYGTHGKRPHYHCIMFSNTVTQSDILKSWQYGAVYFGKVEPASVRYTVQYYDKGDWRPAHGRDDRVKEYSRMSNGIGKSFMTDHMAKHMLANPQNGYIYNSQGHKIAIPRYYKKRLYDANLTDSLVANHPTLLMHRDDMLLCKDVHHKAVAAIMQEVLQEPDNEERNQDRIAAIINYRAKKRKTRN